MYNANCTFLSFKGLTSGELHLIGNLAPSEAVYSSSCTNLDKPKSATWD